MTEVVRQEGVRVAAGDGGGAGWRKSSRSGATGACVEVCVVDGAVLIRDSKNPNGPVLTFTQAAWAEFVAAVADDEFELPRP
jgi:hypothetical protein